MAIYALQQVKAGCRTGKIWLFSSRELAQQSVVATYQQADASSLMQTHISVSANFVQISTNYMGNIYFTIAEVIASDTVITLE